MKIICKGFMDKLIVFETNTVRKPQSMKFLYFMSLPQTCILPYSVIDRY